MYRAINKYISSLPVGEYITDSMNTNVAKMSEGYCFNKHYKPQNGIISFNSSAVNTNYVNSGRTRVNTKIRYQDTISNTAAPTTGSLQYESLFGGSTGSTPVLNLINSAVYMTATLATPERTEYLSNKKRGPNAPAIAAPFNPRGGNEYLYDTTTPIDGQPGLGTASLPTVVDVPNVGANGDGYGFGYNNEMQYYTSDRDWD